MHREEGLELRRRWSRSTWTSTTRWTPDSLHSYHRFMWENLFSQRRHRSRRTCTSPTGDVPREQVEDECRRVRGGDPRGRAASTSSSSASAHRAHRLQRARLSGLESRTRLVTLDPVTRKDAAADFFGEENVPREAITMGVGTILEAREIVILATGEHKAAHRAPRGRRARSITRSPRRSCSATPTPRSTSTAPPRAALTRIATPWLLDAVDVDRRAGRSRAVVWLSRETEQGDPQADPARLRRAPAVVAGGAQHGSPGRAERPRLQRARREDPRPLQAARRQRVICFSPHPDDDVISMGGHPAQAGRERERRSPSPT